MLSGKPWQLQRVRNLGLTDMDAKRQAQLTAIAARIRSAIVKKDAGWEPDLAGYCAIASAALWRALAAHSIKAEIHAWESPAAECHVFLTVDDWILDITATQFKETRNEKVFLRHSRDQSFYFYEVAKTFENPKQLIKWQQSTNWPLHQMAAH
jgi:hypothetical protein